MTIHLSLVLITTIHMLITNRHKTAKAAHKVGGMLTQQQDQTNLAYQLEQPISTNEFAETFQIHMLNRYLFMLKIHGKQPISSS